MRTTGELRLDAKPGTKVRVTKSIYRGDKFDRAHAVSNLDVDKIYTVDRIDVGSWRSKVYFKEVDKIGFNTVLFDEIAED